MGQRGIGSSGQQSLQQKTVLFLLCILCIAWFFPACPRNAALVGHLLEENPGQTNVSWSCGIQGGTRPILVSGLVPGVSLYKMYALVTDASNKK